MGTSTNGALIGFNGIYDSHALYSDDHGETWKLSEKIGTGANECAVAKPFPSCSMRNNFCALDGSHLEI